MFIIVVQAVIVYAISCALWKLLRRFLSIQLWTIYQVYLPNPFCLMIDFESLTLAIAFLSSIRSPGVFPQIFNIKGWEFHKEYLRILHQQDADALQMGVLSRLRPSLGLVLALFSIFQIDPDRNLRKINFFVFDPKALHHIIVKVGFLYIHHESIFLSPQDQYIYEETSASIQ